jgi:hypothetical protein
MNDRIGPITIDFETADKITYLNLKNYRDTLQHQLDTWKANPRTDTNESGVWMHPDDVVESTKAIDAINILFNHFNSYEHTL